LQQRATAGRKPIDAGFAHRPGAQEPAISAWKEIDQRLSLLHHLDESDYVVASHVEKSNR
jgi:hypothetical protein